MGSDRAMPLAPLAIQRRSARNSEMNLRAMTNRIGEVSDWRQQPSIEGLMHLAGA
jgi:hypothetical protein